VKMAMKRELQVMSAENSLKRVHVGTDDDDDGLPLLYPFDADQVPFSACCLLSLCSLYHHCVNCVNKWLHGGMCST